MASKKTFTLEINGVEKSIKDITSLAEALDKLEDKISDVTANMEEATRSIDESTDASTRRTDALKEEEAAEEKLAEAMEKVARAHTEASQAASETTAEMQAGQQSTTAAANSIERMTTDLDELKKKRDQLDMNSEEFRQCEKAIEKLSGILKEATNPATSFSDTINIATNGAMGLAQVLSESNQILTLFGDSSRENAKQAQQLQKVMALISAVQGINNNLIKSGTLLKLKDVAAEKARALQVGLSTGATNLSSLSLKLFSKALVATGVGAFVVLLGNLIANFDDIKKAVLNACPALKNLGEYFDEFKSIVMGVGEVIINHVLMPIRLWSTVTKKIIEGDIIGAFTEGFAELKKGYDVIGNFQKGHQDQTIRNEEAAARKRAEISAKDVENTIKDNEAKYGSDWKYRDEGIKEYTDFFEKRMAMYAKDSEEYKEAQREKWSYELGLAKYLGDRDKETEDKAKSKADATAQAAKREADAKIEAQKAYINKLKSFLSETNQLEISNLQEKINREKNAAEKLKATTDEELKARNKAIEKSYNDQLELNKRLAKDEEAAAKASYDELIAAAVKAGEKTEGLEKERDERLTQLRQGVADKAVTINSEMNEKIAESNKNYSADLKKKVTDDIAETDRRNNLVLSGLEATLQQAQLKIKEMVVKNKNGLGLIDIAATKKNYKDANDTLDEYIKGIKDGLDTLEKDHKKNIAEIGRIYGHDSKEYEEAMQKYVTTSNQLNSKLDKANKEREDNTKASGKVTSDYFKDMFEKVGEYAKTANIAISSVTDTLNMSLKNQIDDLKTHLEDVTKKYEETTKLREESTSRVEDLEQRLQDASGGTADVLKEQLQSEMHNRQELEREEQRLAKEKEKREAEIAKKEKQVKRNDLISQISGSIATTASAVVGALGNKPWGPWNFALAALVGAMGAAQVGIMTKQLSKLEDGGLINGPSHANGGARIQGTNIEVEGGEYVVNKKSTAANTRLIEFINNSRSTVTAADLVGIVPSESGTPVIVNNNNNNLDYEALADAMTNITLSPTVAVTDIMDAQDTVVNVRDLAGF